MMFDVDSQTVSLTAYRIANDKIVPGSEIDLRPFVKAGKLIWTAPSGQWCVSQVGAFRRIPSLDPMNRLLVPNTPRRFWPIRGPQSGRGRQRTQFLLFR